MKHETKRLLIGTIITFIASLVVAALIFVIRSLFNLGAGKEFFTYSLINAIDSLISSGGLGIMICCIAYLSRAGAFDILSYAMKVVWYNTFRRNLRQTELPSSYAKYKELKHGEKQESLLFLVLGSLPTLFVGLILLIPYNLM